MKVDGTEKYPYPHAHTPEDGARCGVHREVKIRGKPLRTNLQEKSQRTHGLHKNHHATSLGPWLACRYPGPLSPDLLTGAPRMGVKLCTLTGLPGSETVLQLNSKKAGLSESTSCWANNWCSNEEDRVGRTPLEIEYLRCWGTQYPHWLSNTLGGLRGSVRTQQRDSAQR